MNRLPASVVVLLLAREAADKGRPELAVTATTLRSWRHRRHLSAGRGYDVIEVLAYVESRTARMAA